MFWCYTDCIYLIPIYSVYASIGVYIKIYDFIEMGTQTHRRMHNKNYRSILKDIHWYILVVGKSIRESETWSMIFTLY